MRLKLFIVLAALCLLPVSCSKSVVLSVDATITFHCTDGYDRKFGPATYEGFGGRHLKSGDIYAMFDDLRLKLNENKDYDFSTATMYLDVYDKISDDFLYSEAYEFYKVDGHKRRGYEYRSLN